jgi:hypothetical protein
MCEYEYESNNRRSVYDGLLNIVDVWVAAWINAETGVGPSIASGSQVCSGMLADFPIAASSRKIPMAVNAVSLM